MTAFTKGLNSSQSSMMTAGKRSVKLPPSAPPPAASPLLGGPPPIPVSSTTSFSVEEEMMMHQQMQQQQQMWQQEMQPQPQQQMMMRQASSLMMQPMMMSMSNQNKANNSSWCSPYQEWKVETAKKAKSGTAVASGRKLPMSNKKSFSSSKMEEKQEGDAPVFEVNEAAPVSRTQGRGRGALLGAIKQGAKLKSVPTSYTVSKDSGPPLDPRMSATLNERGDIVSFGEDYNSDEDFSSSSDSDERTISYRRGVKAVTLPKSSMKNRASSNASAEEYYEDMDEVKEEYYKAKQEALKAKEEAATELRRQQEEERRRQAYVPQEVTIRQLFRLQNTTTFGWTLVDISSLNLDDKKIITLLENAGAKSLGATVYQALCVLVASEIVVYYVKKYVQKIVSKTAITDEDIAKILRATDHQKFTKAVEFLKSANRKHPSLYKRLELGNSWDEVIVNIITNCYG